MGKNTAQFASREDLEESAGKMLCAAKTGYILLSILIGALGITLMAVPDFSRTLLCWLGGILLIAFGGIRILGYFSRDLYRLAFQYDLAFGILLILLGLLLILRTEAMVQVLCLLLGLAVLTDALMKIQISLDARAFGLGSWWMILTAAVITGVLGFLLVVRPRAGARVIMILLGLSFLGEGVLSLVTVLTAVQILKKKYPRCPGEG